MKSGEYMKIAQDLEYVIEAIEWFTLESLNKYICTRIVTWSSRGNLQVTSRRSPCSTDVNVGHLAGSSKYCWEPNSLEEGSCPHYNLGPLGCTSRGIDLWPWNPLHTIVRTVFTFDTRKDIGIAYWQRSVSKLSLCGVLISVGRLAVTTAI